MGNWNRSVSNFVFFLNKIEGNAWNYCHEEVAYNKWELEGKMHSFLPTIIALITRWITRKNVRKSNAGINFLTTIFY